MDVIVTHDMSDFDAFASCVAAQKLYPGAVVALRRRLSGAVHDFLALHRDRFPTVPEREVDPGGVRLLVVVDVRRRSRLAAYEPILRRVDAGEVPLHLYDHHAAADDDLHGDLEVVEPVGSATTLLVERLRARGLPVDPIEATLFALGIHNDTGSLTHGGTTARDATAFAWLLDQGARLGAAYRWLRPPLGDGQRDALLRLLGTARVERFGGLPVAFARVHLPAFVDGLADVTSAALDLEGHPVLFATFDADGKAGVQVVARARSPWVDVGRILARLGGGGHRSAAALRTRGLSPEAVEARLRAAIREAPPRPRTVADVMSSPVHVAHPDTPLAVLEATLGRWGHTGAPVLDAGGRLVGVVSRRDVDKARERSLLHAPVSGFMSHDVKTTAPDAALDEAVDAMMRADVGRLPVLRRDRVVGIVTRSDVLAHLYAERPGDEVPAR